MSDGAAGTFPSIPKAAWWRLRAQFKKSMPNEVTPMYVAAVLSMQEASALANIVRPLQRIGIIDESGKLTTRGRSWREDSDYAAVCTEIIEAVYPQSLRDVSPPDHFNGSAAKSWFSKTTGGGENAIGKQLRFYQLLCEKDPSGATQASTQRTVNAKGKPARVRSTMSATREESVLQGAALNPRNSPSNSLGTQNEMTSALNPPPTRDAVQRANPSVHIDIQIHISSDATAQQIDAIFASMAKHLYAPSSDLEHASK